MTPAQQDARATHKLETSRQQAVQIRSAFKPGTAEHCLAGVVLKAVGIAEERVAVERVVLQERETAAQPVGRIAGAGRYG